MEEPPQGKPHERKRSRSPPVPCTAASHSPVRRTSSGASPPPPPHDHQKPADPVSMLVDVLPEELSLLVVACVQSKEGRDTLALTCKKLRAMGSSFRHCLRFEYNTGSSDHDGISSSMHTQSDARANHAESEHASDMKLSDADDDVDDDGGRDADDDHGSVIDKGDSPQNRACRKWNKLPKFLLQAIRAYPIILSITIKGCDRNKATDLPMIDLSSVFVPPNFKDLTTLKIAAVDGINDLFMAQLSQTCHNLNHLDLKHCQLLTDAALASLATHCQQLTFLKIHCFRDTLTDNGVSRLLAHCMGMTTLSLNGCTGVKGSGFEQGRALTTLEADECGITWKDIRRGLRGLVALRKLSLAYTDVSEDLGILIAQHCQGIEELDLQESYGLQNLGIVHMVRSCPGLRILRVNFCVSVDLQGWCAVAEYGLNLEELEVRGCEGFCGASLREVQNGCPSLRSLKLANAFLPPNPEFLQFVQARPDVKVEIYDDDETFDRVVYPRAP